MTATAPLTADFKTPPYLHQLREFEQSAELPTRALLWQMRTGKTKVTIDTACHLRKAGKIDAVLIFAPNGVHKNWIVRELPIHHWSTIDRSEIVWDTSIAGSAGGNSLSKAKRQDWEIEHADFWESAKRSLEDSPFLWASFNSESMTRDDVRKLVARILKYRTVMVVFDESHNYRTPGSKRTLMARALTKRCAYRRILTGTPVTNSPLHAFSQYELLEPQALGFSNFENFKDRYAVYRMDKKRNGRRYPTLDRYQNLDELRDRIAPYSSVLLREDCTDLPDLVLRDVVLKPSDKQIEIYKKLHRQFIIELGGEEVSVGENTARLMKLQQVMSGFLIDEYGDLHDVPGANPRLDALSTEVDLCPGKVIVWCQFREDIRRVVERLSSEGHEVLQYHGGTPERDRAKVRELFAPGSDNDVKVLVAQPLSAGEGLDLSAAARIVWYSHTFDAIARGQADERATAMGGENVQIINLVVSEIDRYILDKVTGKISVASDVAGRGLKTILEEINL